VNPEHEATLKEEKNPMKRMHIHVGVDNLDESIRFYSSLFGAPPIKTKSDYAKWLVDDPRINFAISVRAGRRGIDHLGLQVDDEQELGELRNRFKQADLSVYDEGETVCCYARSDKTWVKDPSGVEWETYRTMEDAEFYHGAAKTREAVCCKPDMPVTDDCCLPR
jgi:catechol 2,3-dioxygenase-like lactoylglutathione lyase family enzyme